MDDIVEELDEAGVQTPAMTVQEIHTDVFEEMNDVHPYFVKHFLALGNPYDITFTPYAAVTWDKNAGVEFGINSENVGRMTLDEQLFVCMHETMHVLLMHNHFNFPNKAKQNIAQDIVINDYLVSKGIPGLKGVCYGMDLIGMDGSTMSVKDVYDLLPDDIEDDMKDQGIGDACDGHGQPTNEGGNGPIPDEFLEWFKNQGGVFSDFVDAQTDTDPMKAFGAGQGEGDPENWTKQNNVSMLWAELLEDLCPDIFRGKGGTIGRQSYTFNRLNRKVAWMAPKIVLPVRKPNRAKEGDEGEQTPLIVIAIDTSGSVSERDKKDFITLARSIPQNKIELRCISFTTVARELDLEKPVYHSGGTSFQCIEDYIQNNTKKELGKYPDAIVVITDGDALFNRKPERPESWLWLFNNNRKKIGGYYGDAQWDKLNWRGKANVADYSIRR